jgi:hypothetical protein
VELGGLEPPTSWVRSRRSPKLSYSPVAAAEPLGRTEFSRDARGRTGRSFAVAEDLAGTLCDMGLLDDAIREHLDLKRARGADPTEIERLEREALGPVRRERGIGVPQQVEAPERYEPGRTFSEEPTGYHDSTAPQVNHEHPAPPLNLAGAHAQEDGAPVDELDSQQRRRGFLRRRPASVSQPPELEHDGHEHSEGEVHFEPVHDDPLPPHDDVFLHDEPLLDDAPLAHDEPLLHDAPLAHDEPAVHVEPLAHDELPAHEELPAHDQPPAHQPPPLAFEAPPERPRFAPEPPTTIDTPHIADEHPPTDHPDPVERPEPADLREQPAPHHDEPQPTREFDVLAETGTETGTEAETAAGAEQEEDPLEETPEFLQDTPEHDRLWFEQRPPRDFDFDG